MKANPTLPMLLVVGALVLLGCNRQGPEYGSIAKSPALPTPAMFGIGLGSGLSHRLCIEVAVETQARDYCLYPKDGDQSRPGGELREFEAKFAGGEMPSWVDRPMQVGAIDGRVELITVITGGLEDQHRVQATLSQKFGPPTELVASHMQNGFGAQFTSIRARWEFGEWTLTHSGVVEGTNKGAVILSSRAADAALVRRYSDKARPL